VRSGADAGRPVADLFADQVAATPGAPAVVLGDATLTYAELGAAVDRLAARLQRLGVGPDVPVGVCLPRSPEMVVAVLAALRAGGGYAPLDPALPQARLALMLEDLEAPVIVTCEALRDALPETPAAVVLVDRDDPAVADPAVPDPAVPEPAVPEPITGPGPTPDDLGYVLFTSGSTGRPKAVEMPQGPLVNLIDWQRRAWREPAAARTLQYASLGFDVAFQEIVGTLANGGTLVLCDEDTRRDPDALVRLIHDGAVERVFVPYVALVQLAEASERLGLVPSRLREVMTAGEALQSTPAIRRFFAATGAVLHNQYGPTESHVVTEHTLGPDPERWPARPPIGRPIDNARIAVLDRYGHPVPVGVPGELCIGGPVLARGYRRQPERTAERFVTDPVLGPPHRIYRTGDRARWLPDGDLEYLGRIDTQVKIRGVRVEPAEVEAVLAAHPAIRECAVDPRRGASGDLELVAYLVCRERAPRLWASVQEHLRAHLPEAMVPARAVFLDALPLSPNRKLDRRALPDPSPDDALEDDDVPPTGPIEEGLAAIVAEVLGRSRIGVTTNFFSAGGSSLHATRVAVRVRATFGVEFPLRVLYEGPSVAEMATWIGQSLVTGADFDDISALLDELDPTGAGSPEDG
jgi:amino acid adenylation domain-containing protein